MFNFGPKIDISFFFFVKLILDSNCESNFEHFLLIFFCQLYKFLDNRGGGGVYNNPISRNINARRTKLGGDM